MTSATAPAHRPLKGWVDGHGAAVGCATASFRKRVDEQLGAPTMKPLSRIDAATLNRSPVRRNAGDGAQWWKRRLAQSRLRSRLRARPRLQGRVLAPAGMFCRLPTTAGLYFPFYHDVLPRYGEDLRRHLLTFQRIGPLV